MSAVPKIMNICKKKQQEKEQTKELLKKVLNVFNTIPNTTFYDLKGSKCSTYGLASSIEQYLKNN